jgi:TRAP-type mannitol/chloroaromatic compound transport system permease large subunit
LLIVLYFTYVLLVTWWNPKLAPAAVKGENDTVKFEGWMETAIAAGLPLGVVLLVLASIYFGIAAPSEGGAIGVTGVLLLGLVRRRLTMRNLKQALDIAGILVSCVSFLLLGSSFFTLVFRGLNGHVWIESMFQHIPAGQVGFLIFVNLGIFFLAFFLDFFEIAFIVLPLIAPIAHKSGVDMIWLTILIAVNLQTSFMHPPFGIALYNLRSVTPRIVKTVDIYLGAVPFLLIQLVMVIILILAPGIVSEQRSAPVDVSHVKIKIDLPKMDVPEFK